MQNFDTEKLVAALCKDFETSQYNYLPNFELVKDLPIVTRQQLQKIPMKKGLYTAMTSGSTGEPVTVQKSFQDYIWYIATNIREIQWRKWNFSKTMAVIKTSVEKRIEDFPDWRVSKLIAKNQGKSYVHYQSTIQELQAWLEEKNPHYIHGYPSVLNQLDLKKISNLIDVKSTGETGGTMYSSEECGTIAIQCPSNKQNYHVMENQLVEVNDNNELIITTLTNPYLKRYKIGDIGELGTCTCGRSLQTITKIYGRVRNMFVLPSGDKKWPIFGSRAFHDKYGIRQFKLIQTSIQNLNLQIISNKLLESEENKIKDEMNALLGADCNIDIEYVKNFPNYKHEEFVSLISANQSHL